MTARDPRMVALANWATAEAFLAQRDVVIRSGGVEVLSVVTLHPSGDVMSVSTTVLEASPVERGSLDWYTFVLPPADVVVPA